MAEGGFAGQRHRKLDFVENAETFERWQANILYGLHSEPSYADFIGDDVTWCRKRDHAVGGLTADAADAEGHVARSAAQKNATLEEMIRMVCNYAPILNSKSILRNCTSLNFIWKKLRSHYQIEDSGANFLDFANITMGVNERPEDLYVSLDSFMENHLLKRGRKVQHDNLETAVDEVPTAMVDNLIVLTWLRLIHKDLPRFIKQKYATDLRTKTIFTIRPEISMSLDSLLDELKATQEVRSMRADITEKVEAMRVGNFKKEKTKYRDKGNKGKKDPPFPCTLCDQNNCTPTNHYLSACPYMPEREKKRLLRANAVAMDEVYQEPDDDSDDSDEDDNPDTTRYTLPRGPRIARVTVIRSPTLPVRFGKSTTELLIDTGSESSLIHIDEARRLRLDIKPNTIQIPSTADFTEMDVAGEARAVFSRGDLKFKFDALVINKVSSPIIGGNSFCWANDITVRSKKAELTFEYYYDPALAPDQSQRLTTRRITANVVRGPAVATTLCPGDTIALELPPQFSDHSHCSGAPIRYCSVTPATSGTGMAYSRFDNNVISLTNSTSVPFVLRPGDHVCSITELVDDDVPSRKEVESLAVRCVPTKSIYAKAAHCVGVRIDPDRTLDSTQRGKLAAINVFNSVFRGYNGASGQFKAHVNMGPTLPPQRKGKLLQYSRNRLLELQDKFDELESLGVIARAEDHNMKIEYLSPSFLVKKPNGSFRMVTAFADVGRYSKPQLSVLPDVNETLRQIARWKYLCVTDLTSAYYQVPISHDSMKYCGISSPFHGSFVYTRCAMGMPGAETGLSECLARILQDPVRSGNVAKIADDLYCGSDTFDGFLECYADLLRTLNLNGMCLKAAKTILCPATATILGWILSRGAICL